MSKTKVSEVMSPDVSVCRPSDSLDVAARVMWERDCGFVPVVDALGGLVGVLTDRDVCMAGYIGGAGLAEIPVVRAMAREVVAVGEEDALESAEALLRTHALHRLPVIDAERRVVGVISVADLVQAADAEPTTAARKRAAGTLLDTLASVTRPRRVAEPIKMVEPQPRKRAGARAAPASVKTKPAAQRKTAKRAKKRASR